jgi:hypothetical protein
MLPKIVAALLLFLTISPFTPPFSTCDVSTLFGGQTQLMQFQVTLAWSVDEDANAIAPNGPSRRVRMGIRSDSDTEATTATWLAPRPVIIDRSTTHAPLPAPVPRPGSPLRI